MMHSLFQSLGIFDSFSLVSLIACCSINCHVFGNFVISSSSSFKSRQTHCLMDVVNTTLVFFIWKSELFGPLLFDLEKKHLKIYSVVIVTKNQKLTVAGDGVTT